jgi:hypothetical protein
VTSMVTDGTDWAAESTARAVLRPKGIRSDDFGAGKPGNLVSRNLAASGGEALGGILQRPAAGDGATAPYVFGHPNV